MGYGVPGEHGREQEQAGRPVTDQQDDPSASNPPPLAGLVVLDLGQIYCGPYCGFLLARMGAEVIKIESPTGELTRHRSPPEVQPVALTLLNTNKDGVRLDLKTEEGKATFRSLVARADVVVENFAAGVMDRLGVGYDELRKINPRLVYAGATGFGREGPYNKLNAMDLTVQAMTGVLDSNGYANAPPVKAGVAVADFAGGTHLAVGILAALFQRTITGVGQRVDVSMQDALLPYLTSNISGYLTSGPNHPPRTGNQHGSLSVSPYNVYEAVDGFVAILCAADRHWRSMCRLMGREDLADSPKFAVMTARAEHNDEVDTLMTSLTRTRARADIVGALKASNDYCARAYAISDAEAARRARPSGSLARSVLGPSRTRFYVLAMNAWHDNEHYGNVVTYMRLRNMVPPSSQSPNVRAAGRPASRS